MKTSKKKKGIFSRMREKRLEKIQMKQKKAEIIGKVIYHRNFDVPIHFIYTTMTNDVMDYIVDNSPIKEYALAGYSSIAMMNSELDSNTIRNYKSFMAQVRACMKESLIHMDFTRKSFLQQLTTPMAILTLSSNAEWTAWLKLKKKNNPQRASYLLYLSLLIEYMYELSYDIPSVVIDTVLRYDYDELLQHYVSSKIFHFSAFDYLIRQADKQNKLGCKLQLVWQYWSLGGVYFPESVDFLDDILIYINTGQIENEHCIEQVMLYLDNVKKAKVTCSYGYYLFSYIWMLQEHIGWEVYHMFFGLTRNPFYIGRDDTLKKIKEYESSVVCGIFDDMMLRDTQIDINVLEYLFRLPLKYPNKAYRELKEKFGISTGKGWQDQDLKLRIEGLMVYSKTSLKDMKLYKKMFNPCNPHVHLIEDFIIHGGRPITLAEANIPDYANICYKLDGIALMLKHTPDDNDIIPMFNDPQFVDALKQIAVDKSTSGILDVNCVTRLLSIIMKLDGILDSLENLVDHLLRLLGGKIPLECVEYYVKKPNVKINSTVISSIIEQNKAACIEKIPAYLLPKRIIEQRVRSGDSLFLKLNTDDVSLDHIFSSNELDLIFLSLKRYQYIPDLSYEYMQQYLGRLVELE